MRVAMIARSTLRSDPGGDTVQVLSTAANLNKLGVEVEIKKCGDRINYSDYDLLHFFNIIRPADILKHAAKSTRPYVVSTIFVDYSEYEQKARSGWTGTLSKFLNADQQEYLKAIARRLNTGEKIESSSYLRKGHGNSIRFILKNAALLLPNSENEYKRLLRAYGVSKEYKVIPNGIDEEVFKASSSVKEKDLVICAARIEGRKNQLNLIRALNGTGFRLVIIGKHSPNHKKYYEQCRKEAGSNVSFIDRVEQEELVKLYSSAKVHALPSWFETTGLSSLEAAAMGCNIVITDKGDTREYYGKDAFYCQPDNVNSVRKAVEDATGAGLNGSLKNKILSCYTWKIAAEKTRDAYEMVLNKKTVK